ncbi:hypothetical protein SISSUDRAFT_1035132 [Sistotremastrum suecicum HHB10207 ss-3]|uniref:Uncharacterized protein n=1 Tax=Sistotremastrum suecicum HHB10207 ss-3 TaxID=1314776 RepID=A0A166B5I4_9AGAM|nr:hypothetical protein SISSUDRAFT_1035132 [Sistotremastrum suecicum HHB10207 ss-3]
MSTVADGSCSFHAEEAQISQSEANLEATSLLELSLECIRSGALGPFTTTVRLANKIAVDANLETPNRLASLRKVAMAVRASVVLNNTSPTARLPQTKEFIVNCVRKLIPKVKAEVDKPVFDYTPPLVQGMTSSWLPEGSQCNEALAIIHASTQVIGNARCYVMLCYVMYTASSPTREQRVVPSRYSTSLIKVTESKGESPNREWMDGQDKISRSSWSGVTLEQSSVSSADEKNVGLIFDIQTAEPTNSLRAWECRATAGRVAQEFNRKRVGREDEADEIVSRLGVCNAHVWLKRGSEYLAGWRQYATGISESKGPQELELGAAINGVCEGVGNSGGNVDVNHSFIQGCARQDVAE